MKFFIRILLVSVVLNLADWPYVDEIFGSAGPVSELLASSEQVGQVPVRDSGAVSRVQRGYQLLLGLQAIAQSPLPLQAPSRDKASPREVAFAHYLIPPRIDRPPTRSTLS